MAIRMKTSVTLKASAECPTHSKAEVSIRDLVRFQSMSQRRAAEQTQGRSPTDTALAALVGCTNVIGHKNADRLGVDIGHLSIEASCEFDRRGVILQEEIEVPFTSIRLDVVSNGSASEDDLAHVASETEKFCPLSKLFAAAGTKLEVHWRKARWVPDNREEYDVNSMEKPNIGRSVDCGGGGTSLCH